ncbi:methylated-DNA--[protein]-cysteine S-methyltransferase [Microbacterium murale]|uniref:Methylated-DNA--protein-cysteine methyltransferase n=1 Tax=Microbacterium murale TaxID=1081040 RepID=A0ABQ1S005_9MICO|nr:methylated-DNA--[protein]-cysteine S-methyltransferase [Microbacterium murale]GGD87769.1 methylated-DNA--protein-cysteine methyltransferase [Microbacterium murale]
MSSAGTLSSPVGHLTVMSSGEAITRVAWRSGSSDNDSPHDPLLIEALRQLRAYFDGRLTRFDLPFDLGSQTDVTRAVLTTLAETVDHGQSVTYGELAARSGTSIPARGVGAVMGANPIPIIVPCHRVVASDGLGGYSGGDSGQGLLTKRWLLEFEGALPTALF